MKTVTSESVHILKPGGVDSRCWQRRPQTSMVVRKVWRLSLLLALLSILAAAIHCPPPPISIMANSRLQSSGQGVLEDSGGRWGRNCAASIQCTPILHNKIVPMPLLYVLPNLLLPHTNKVARTHTCPGIHKDRHRQIV